jgi:methyl-accepting chemotaxis protein
MLKNVKFRTKLVIFVSIILIVLTVAYFTASTFTTNELQNSLEIESTTVIEETVVDNAQQTGVRIADLSESTREYVSDLWELDVYDIEYLKANPNALIEALPIIHSIRIPQEKAEDLNIDFDIVRVNARNEQYEAQGKDIEVFNEFQAEQLKEKNIKSEEDNMFTYYRGIYFTDDCLNCHGGYQRVSTYWNKYDGLDPTGKEPENFNSGDFYAMYKIGVDLTQADMLAQNISNTFEKRATEEASQGNMLKIIIGIVLLILAIIAVLLIINRNFKRVNKLVNVSTDIARGDLSIDRVDTRNNDEIGKLAMAMNKMVTSLKEKSLLIESIADGDLSVDVPIESDEDEVGYSLQKMISSLREKSRLIKIIAEGDFTVKFRMASDRDEVGKSLKAMIKALNNIFRQIHITVEEVNNGAEQLSQSSQHLSEGASDQAASLEEVSAALSQISEQVQSNNENVAQANKYSNQVKENAEKGSNQMDNMVKAINQINNSAGEIKKIVKVIDDIAFQTNLLSLNASIEAARVGKFGKGFAVVAESVRNLAAESKESVKETTEQVDKAIKNIEIGTELVNKTAEQFESIKKASIDVSEFVSDVSNSYQEQTRGIEQISTALNQVENVVQSNTANAEENASTSEELSLQAQTLKDMLAQFKFTFVDDDEEQRKLPPKYSIENLSIKDRKKILGQIDQMKKANYKNKTMSEEMKSKKENLDNVVEDKILPDHDREENKDDINMVVEDKILPDHDRDKNESE